MDYEVIDEMIIRSKMDLEGESEKALVAMILRAVKGRVEEIEDFATDEYYKVNPGVEAAFLRNIFDITKALDKKLEY